MKKYLYWISSKGQTGYWESMAEHTAARVAFSGVGSRSSALGTGILHVKAFEQHRGRKGEESGAKEKDGIFILAWVLLFFSLWIGLAKLYGLAAIRIVLYVADLFY